MSTSFTRPSYLLLHVPRRPSSRHGSKQSSRDPDPLKSEDMTLGGPNRRLHGNLQMPPHTPCPLLSPLPSLTHVWLLRGQGITWTDSRKEFFLLPLTSCPLVNSRYQSFPIVLTSGTVVGTFSEDPTPTISQLTDEGGAPSHRTSLGGLEEYNRHNI